jgi:tripartite-type tricarboxylate transporter receptor subunit TctC
VSSGTGGPGTPSHISAVYFGNTVGKPLNIIHYKGSGPALQDVIAGHIQMTFDQAANALPQIRAGRIRAYAVTQKTRLASAPDVPTTDEAGLPGFYMSVWHAFWVPKGTPKEAIQKLNAAMREALADPAVRKRLEDLGQEIPAARPAIARGAARLPPRRARQVGAAHQGGRHQGELGWRSDGAPTRWRRRWRPKA